MSNGILKRVDVVVIFPDGRTISGFSMGYPESSNQVMYQVWDYNEKDSWLVNLHKAESISLKPTFEGE